MYELSSAQLQWVSGGTRADIEAGMADGEAAGGATAQTAKAVLLIAGVIGLVVTFM